MIEWIVFGFLLLLQVYVAYLGIKILLWLDKTYKIKLRVSVLIFLGAFGGWIIYQKYVYDPFYCSQEKRYLSDQEFIDESIFRLINHVAHNHKLAYVKSPTSDEYIYSEEKYQILSLKIKRYFKEHSKSKNVIRDKNDTNTPFHVSVVYIYDSDEVKIVNDYFQTRNEDSVYPHQNQHKQIIGMMYTSWYGACGNWEFGTPDSLDIAYLQNKQFNTTK